MAMRHGVPIDARPTLSKKPRELVPVGIAQTHRDRTNTKPLVDAL